MFHDTTRNDAGGANDDDAIELSTSIAHGSCTGSTTSAGSAGASHSRPDGTLSGAITNGSSSWCGAGGGSSGGASEHAGAVNASSTKSPLGLPALPNSRSLHGSK